MEHWLNSEVAEARKATSNVPSIAVIPPSEEQQLEHGNPDDLNFIAASSAAATGGLTPSDPDPYFTLLLNGYNGNEKIVLENINLFGKNACNEKLVSRLLESNFLILVALIERFGLFYAPQRELPMKYNQQLKKIVQILVVQILNKNHPNYEQVMEKAGDVIHLFEKHIDCIPILQSISTLCEQADNNLTVEHSGLMPLVKLVHVLIKTKRTCFFISSSPRCTKTIMKTLFFAAEEKCSTLRDWSLQALLKFVSNLKDDETEAERFLATNFVDFTKDVLKLVEHQVATDHCTLATLLFVTLQLSCHGVVYGLEKVNQKQYMNLISNKIKKMRNREENLDVDKSVSKLFAHSLNACFEDFFSSFQKIFNVQIKSPSCTQGIKVSASSKSKSPTFTMNEEVSNEAMGTRKKSPLQRKVLDTVSESDDSDDGETEAATGTTARVTRLQAKSSGGKKAKKTFLDVTMSEDEGDYEDYMSPRPTASLEKVLKAIPDKILNMSNPTPSKMAVKILKYIFNEQELIECGLPPILGRSDRKEFPPKKVEIFYALLEKKFPGVDPLLYLDDVKTAVGTSCRHWRKRLT